MCWVGRLTPYLLTFRAVNTHILAPLRVAESFRRVAPPLTTDDLMGALRAGRCFTSFNLMADAAGFRFAAHAGAGGTVIALMGDDVQLQDGLVLAAQCPVPGSVELLRDGVPIRRQEGRELLHPVDRPGVYRIGCRCGSWTAGFPGSFPTPSTCGRERQRHRCDLSGRFS